LKKSHTIVLEEDAMNKTFKLFTALSLAGALFTTCAAGAFASDTPNTEPVPMSNVLPVQENGVKVYTKAVHEQTDHYKAVLNIPAIQDMMDSKFQDALNAAIYENAMKDLEAIKKQAEKEALVAKPSHPFEIIVQFEVKAGGGEADKNRFSLSVTTYTYTGGAHGITRTDNYNALNVQPASRITLESLFGNDYKKTIDASIQSEIDKHPEGGYFEDTVIDIGPEQSFYIENGQVVVQFSPYEIAPYAAGTPEFRIPIPGEAPPETAPVRPRLVVSGKSIAADQANIFKFETGVTMVPLRVVTEALGYSVGWNVEQQRADVSKGAQYTYVTIGKDAYIINKIAPFPLGEPPALIEGKTYVPLTFFSDVLKLEVTTISGAIYIN